MKIVSQFVSCERDAMTRSLRRQQKKFISDAKTLDFCCESDRRAEFLTRYLNCLDEIGVLLHEV